MLQIGGFIQSLPLFLGYTAYLACLIAAGWTSLYGDLNLMVFVILFVSSGIENIMMSKVVRYVTTQLESFESYWLKCNVGIMKSWLQRKIVLP